MECPNCGGILNKNAVFCYACNSFLTDDGQELLSPDKVTDEEIQRLLDQSQKDQEKNDKTTRGKIGNFLSGLSMFCYLLILLMGLFGKIEYALILIGVAAVLFLLSMIISPRDAETKLDAKELEEIVTKYIAAVECKNIYGSETYFEPDAAFPEDLIKKAAFYSQEYLKYQGNRLIQGSLEGYPFCAGHVKLMTFHTNNGYKRTINIFDGYCMSIDTDLIFPERININEKYFGCLTQVLKEDKEEAELFYDVFNVTSDHIELAKQYLTPKLRKNLILVSRMYAGTLSIVLSPNGNIFISAGEGENAFAEDEDLSAEKRREEYRKELEFPLKVLKCYTVG